jgi:hypothetical protein
LDKFRRRNKRDDLYRTPGFGGSPGCKAQCDARLLRFIYNNQIGSHWGILPGLRMRNLGYNGNLFKSWP